MTLCKMLGRGGAAVAAVAVALSAACGSDEGADATPASEVEVPDTYAFESGLVAGKSSVSYGGQSMRHLQILAIHTYVAGLTQAIDAGTLPKPGEVKDALLFWYDGDATTAKDVAHGVAVTPAAKQKTWGEIGTAKLSEKIAGNDPGGQHRDWNKVGVMGWPQSPSPDALVRAWIAELEALAADRAAGKIANGADGKPLAAVHVTAAGHDLKELLQKFLMGAITYSQGADDYLDDDLDGKGLLSDHSKAEKDGAPWTALEHAWDEGFGYFGAARDYAAYSDAELAGKGGDEARRRGHFDSNGDGAIDLTSEANFGHALNCAKRDHDAVGKASVDLTGRAWKAFARGRARISATPLGKLPVATLAALKTDRDEALLAWEECIAATVVHYINEALADLAIIESEQWTHANAAKHWSELKGFALSLQFSRRSMLSKAQLQTLHDGIGAAPALKGAGKAAIDLAKAGLLAARGVVMAAYGFPAALSGDDAGAHGW